MTRHKFKDALTVLKDIIGKKYGTYELMDNYGDNFREGPAYENNKESLFEVQFLDLESQGTDDEWTPVNTSPNATQGSAIESNFAPGNYGGWADISASRGSTISSKLSVQLTGNSTHVCTGPSVLMNPTGKISSLVM